MAFKKFSFDSVPIIQLRYDIPDSNTIRLWATKQHDSMFVELVKTKRKFPLEDQQFHWLSEANR